MILISLLYEMILENALGNYMLAKRIKRNNYLKERLNITFGEITSTGIDLVEIINGKVHTYDFKYSMDKKVKVSGSICGCISGCTF